MLKNNNKIVTWSVSINSNMAANTKHLNSIEIYESASAVALPRCASDIR